ncbi:methyltransferase domain-containing protein [Candidatus Saccharibacteria bacterium]|nr:methyltransferase domain-containing protein [Candidatus Saccharibacteria bacterium]MBR3122290.1 methyltransferase domain-containing protein [Candidatus Saccharibacteria bacterium]
MSEKVISDYNGYDYKKEFWEDADREYEDQADRMAIRKLLPKRMDKFADIGGGYGRLANEYLKRAHKVYIFDYSKSELKQAKEIYGDKIETKAGDIYELPFKDNELDGLMMVRVTHHLKDMKKALSELYRVLKPGGVAVIEVANKRTLPKMARYVLRKSDVNPFDKKVANYKEISKDGFYNYHPKYVEEIFDGVGFKTEKVLSVSNFRSRSLKKVFGTKNLVKMEDKAQKALAPIRFAPSIYYKLRKPED